MGTFFVYILKSGTCLLLFYLFYRLLLSRETFHRFNRIALLGLSALALVLPLMRYSLSTPAERETIPALLTNVRVVTEVSQVPQLPVISQETISIDIIYIVLGIYLAGVLFFLLQTGCSFAGLYRLFRSGRTFKQDGIRIILTNRPVAPFSWMNHIVLCEADWQENRQEIITHETGHIRSGHSWDLLLAQACVIIHWFNPAAWLLKQELQNIHEYEADEYVLEKGIDAKNYQLLLIKKAVGSQRFTSMANNFNHSKLKKRITMMLKGKSNPWARMKYLYVLPVSVFITTAFARPEVSNELEKISAVKISEILPDKKENDDAYHITIRNNSVEGIVPENPTKIKIHGVVEGQHPLVIVDEKEIPYEQLGAMDMDQIESMSILNSEQAVEIYGEKAQYGAAVFITKTDNPTSGTEIEQRLEEALSYIDIEQRVEDALSQVDPAQLADSTVAHIEINQLVKESLPLVIMDGQEITMGMMNALNPDYIQSIEVLKDAISITQYGKRGKNGVVRITTKRNATTLYDKEKVWVKNPLNEKNPLILLDGEEITDEEMDILNHDIIHSIEVLKDNSITNTYGEKARHGVILITAKGSENKTNDTIFHVDGFKSDELLLFLVDGEEITEEEFKKLDPQTIESISVLKTPSTVEPYGEKGKNGVVLITLKK